MPTDLIARRHLRKYRAGGSAMQVSEFMRRGIVKAEVTDSLAQAAERMRALEVSALPVFNGVRMVGIITERDMAHAIAERLNPDLVTVFMRMTPEPLAASPADTATETVLMMLEHRIRHLPVLDCGELVGMVSARDLLAVEREALVTPA
ncbi:MAG: CBS domain-containing protein [Chloroflexi bacterium]|nr:MAG: CBS domain-containing protein [Chloroflexota bacterium]TME17360.1 MAG: CBS domain-containing protein [Chloroflexota bacterium]TME18989.1 MAG: CBS domain-containing protein [Chloroflexota bacterium]